MGDYFKKDDMDESFEQDYDRLRKNVEKLIRENKDLKSQLYKCLKKCFEEKQ